MNISPRIHTPFRSAIWRTHEERFPSFTPSFNTRHRTARVEVNTGVILEMIRQEDVESCLVETMAVGELSIAFETAESVLERCDAVLDQGARSPPSNDIHVDLPSPVVED